MKCLVTGCAGFIGSALAEALIREGHQVIGIDRFSSFYDIGVKKENVQSLFSAGKKDKFAFCEFDLNDLALHKNDKNLGEMELIFHLAAQPGIAFILHM